MASTANTSSTTRRDVGPAWPAVLSNLRGVAAGAVALLLLAPSLAIFTRRLCGAFDRPLSRAGLVAAGALVLAGGEILWRIVRREPSGFVSRRFAALAAAASGWMVAAGLSLTGSSPWGLFLIWTLAILETGLGCWRIGRRETIWRVTAPGDRTVQRVSAISAADPAPAAQPPTPRRPEAAAALDDAEAAPAGDPLQPDVVQQIVRREEPGGTHWLSGLVRARFDPGQRVAHAHVAFCPPFPATPSCEAEAVAGPDAEVKVSQLLPHGVRFEARLDRASNEPSDVIIEFATQWPAS